MVVLWKSEWNEREANKVGERGERQDLKAMTMEKPREAEMRTK